MENNTKENLETNASKLDDVSLRTKSKSSEKKNKLLWTLGCVGAVVLFLGSGFYAYSKLTEAPKQVAPPQRTKAVASKSKLKDELLKMGIHFDKNHMKVVNTNKNKLTINVNNDKIVLKEKQYIDYQIKNVNGQIYINNQKDKLAFKYEIQDPGDLFALDKIDYAPATKDITEVAVKNIPSNAKNIEKKSANDSKSDKSDDFCSKAQITNNNDEMRKQFKDIAGKLNLGPLTAMLDPALPRIIQDSEKIQVGSDYVNYVTSEDGKGTLGEYLPDFLQKDQMSLSGINLNLSSALSSSSLSRTVINKTTTAIYPSSLSQQTAQKLIDCY